MGVVAPGEKKKYQIPLLRHTQTLVTGLQQPTFLQVECISSFYCYDAEDCPSKGDASRRKMKQTFENNLKTCLCRLVVHQIVCKRHRIPPSFKLFDEPNAICSGYVYDDAISNTEQ